MHEDKLLSYIPAEQRVGLTGSISRLEQVLACRGANGYEEHIQFLRDLQNLRSSGSAHRKGSKYEEVARQLEVDTQPLPKVFREVLVKALRFIEYLENALDDGVFDLPVPEP